MLSCFCDVYHKSLCFFLSSVLEMSSLKSSSLNRVNILFFIASGSSSMTSWPFTNLGLRTTMRSLLVRGSSQNIPTHIPPVPCSNRPPTTKCTPFCLMSSNAAIIAKDMRAKIQVVTLYGTMKHDLQEVIEGVRHKVQGCLAARTSSKNQGPKGSNILLSFTSELA